MNVIVLTPDEVALLRLLSRDPAEGREASDAAMTVGASYDEVGRMLRFGFITRVVVGDPATHAVLKIADPGRQALLHLPKVR